MFTHDIGTSPSVVACEKERHTAEKKTKWTDEALEAISLTAEGLLGPDMQ